MFYFWATEQISEKNTPNVMRVMNILLALFGLFTGSSLANNELIKMFWHNENTEAAQAYIKTYKSDISDLKKKYEDTETSYE